MVTDDHVAEVDRLWRTLRRRLPHAMLEMAGFSDEETNHMARLMKVWDQLCVTDLDIAAALYHAVEEIYIAMGRLGKDNSPSERLEQQLDEVIGLAQIGRAAHPDAQVRTVGEIVALGEKAVRQEIDSETDDRSDP